MKILVWKLLNEKTLRRRLYYYFPTESRIGCIVNLFRVLIELLGQTKQTVSNPTIQLSMDDIYKESENVCRLKFLAE